MFDWSNTSTGTSRVNNSVVWNDNGISDRLSEIKNHISFDDIGIRVVSRADKGTCYTDTGIDTAFAALNSSTSYTSHSHNNDENLMKWTYTLHPSIFGIDKSINTIYDDSECEETDFEDDSEELDDFLSSFKMR